MSVESPPPPAHSLRSSSGTLGIVAEALALLARSPDPEAGITAALAVAGHGLGADRAYVFADTGERDAAGLPLACAIRNEWVADGVVPQMGQPAFERVVYADALPGGVGPLLSQEPCFVDVQRGPPGLQALRAFAPAACFLLLPVESQGQPWGAVGFDWVELRHPSQDDATALRMLATAIGAVLGVAQTGRLLHAVFAGFEASSDGMAILDDRWVVTHLNAALRRQTGCEPGCHLSELLRGSDQQAADIELALLDGVGWSGLLTCADGGVQDRRCTLAVRPVPGVGHLAVFSDVTRLHQSRARLAHLLHHDALTGLPNRLAFSVDLGRRLGSAGRARVGVLYLDVDGFKTVNDSLGHDEGDGLLVALSRRLVALVGPLDHLYRIGGDEFAVTLAGRRTAADVQHAAGLLLEACRDTYSLPCGAAVYTTASLGVAVYPDDDPTPDASRYMRFADAALFRAKAQGRNRVQRYSASMTQRATRRLTLEAELRAAVEAHRLEVWLQPQFDVAGGHLTGAEALLRWPRDDGAFISPGEFVPLAEETGLIVPITEQVLEATTRAWGPLSEAAGRPLRIAINVSPSQFHHHDVTAMLREALAGSSIPEGGFEVELTESALMLDPQTMGARLTELRDLGLRIAIDDFGTGYSSLSALRRYPLDWLKIDRSFVSDLPDDPGAVVIADTILAMAHALGLRTMAEGVETEAQLEALRARGCTGFQGFLRSPAVPIPVLLARLRADPLEASAGP